MPASPFPAPPPRAHNFPVTNRKRVDPHHDRLDRIVAEARRARDERRQGYRAQALKLFPWICGPCAREFDQTNVHELTVHHNRYAAPLRCASVLHLCTGLGINASAFAACSSPMFRQGPAGTSMSRRSDDTARH
jgi:hypothetical protein